MGESLTLTTDPDVWWDVPDEIYYSPTGHLSASALKLFRSSVPRYHAIHVAKSLPWPESTAAMQLGTVFHTLVLEPEKIDDVVVVKPKFGGKGAVAARAEWVAEHEHLIQVSQADLDQRRGMADAVHADPECRDLMGVVGRVETPFEWVEPESGLKIKCKPDYVRDDFLQVDLKASAHGVSADAFGKAAANFHYHDTAALYMEGLATAGAKYREENIRSRYKFVFVSSEAPHEVAVYELDREALELGWANIDSSLQRLRDCQDTGQWGSRYGGTVKLPGWAFKQVDA